MASINNKLFSLNTKLNVNNQVQKKEIKELIQEEPKKEQSPAKQETPSAQIEPEKSLENDFLLTYRGITINHVETAETKTPVTTIKADVKPMGSTAEPKDISIDKSIVSKSPLASDYKTAVSRVTTPATSSMGLYRAKEMAASDLQTLAETIKTQLKKELGSKYNEKLIQEIVDSAIKQTIKEFEDNKSTKNKDEKAGAKDNGFVYSKTAIFGVKGKTSYNVQSLCNKFIENFNTIAPNKQQQYKEIEEKKAELIEKKDKIKSSYSYSSNYMTFSSNFDKAFEKALNSLTTENYKNADDVITESLNNSLVNLDSKNPNELQGKLDELFTSTSQNYHQMYCPNVSEEDFTELFNNAKNEVLSSVNGKKECDLRAISNYFDENILSAINVYVSSKETAATRSMPPANTYNSDFEYLDIKEPVTIRGSNGYTISYKPNTKDKTCIGTITISKKKGESYTLKLNMAQKHGLGEMLYMMADMNPKLMDDFVKEVDTIDIVNLVPGHEIGSPSAAAADAGNGKIYFVYDDLGTYHKGKIYNPFFETIIAHEVGHMIDSLDNNYGGGQSGECMQLFWDLEKLLPKEILDKYYAFKNRNEFFAEYYAYTMCGDTDNKFAELMNELKNCEKINAIKEKISNDTKQKLDEINKSTAENKNDELNKIDKSLIKDEKTIKAEAKKIKDLINKMTDAFDKIIKTTRKRPDAERNDPKKSYKEKAENIHSVEVPIDNPPVNPTPDKPEKGEGSDPKPPVDPTGNKDKPKTDDDNTTKDKKPSKEPDAKPNPSTEPDKGTPGSDPESNTVENGKETYNPPEKNPGQEGIGNLPSMDSESISKQKAQELYEKYGDGYDIKVDVVKNADGSFTVEYSVTKSAQGANGNGSGNGNGDGSGNGKGDGTGIGNGKGNGKGENGLPDGPTGDITGNSGAGETDSENAPGLDENGKIPVKKEQNSGSGETLYIPGTNIDLMDPKYRDTDGSYNIRRLVKDLVDAGQLVTTTDPEVIKEIMQQVKFLYGNDVSKVWDSYWSELGFGYTESFDIPTNEKIWGSSTGMPKDDDYYNSITAGYSAATNAAEQERNKPQPPPSTAGYTNGYSGGSTGGYNNGYQGNYNYNQGSSAGYTNGYTNGY